MMRSTQPSFSPAFSITSPITALGVAGVAVHQAGELVSDDLRGRRSQGLGGDRAGVRRHLAEMTTHSTNSRGSSSPAGRPHKLDNQDIDREGGASFSRQGAPDRTPWGHAPKQFEKAFVEFVIPRRVGIQAPKPERRSEGPSSNFKGLSTEEPRPDRPGGGRASQTAVAGSQTSPRRPRLKQFKKVTLELVIPRCVGIQAPKPERRSEGPSSNFEGHPRQERRS
jgi:hypothetical protein